jgi:CO/xanthine dehydrogenase Mo-binding subunit
VTIEPERYELHESAAYDFPPSRREFFQRLGGGLLVIALIGSLDAQESGRGQRRGGGRPEMPKEIGAWIHIGEDGTITAYTGKAEVGQNIRTSLTQAVAEELRVPVTSIRMVMGDTDLTPYDMGTFGSLTTPQMAPQIHKAAAAARQTLMGLAAKSWNVDAASLTARDGQVVELSGTKRASYGELTRGQKLIETISTDAPVTPVTEWKIAGKSIPKVDGRAFVTGEHKYCSDLVRPGMQFGKILRPSAFGGKLESFDAAASESMAGVKVVRDGDFAGVTAPNPETAERALKAIRANWKTEAQPSSRELFSYLKEQANSVEPSPNLAVVEQALAEAPVKLRQSYTIAYIAHTPLEPRAAVAEWSGDRLTVWTGTQRPFGVRSELAEAFHIPEDRIRVIMPDTGSGYGGKHTGEAAIEAARLSREAGKPVKLVWTREEEFTWAYARPAGVIEIASGANKDGTITAWAFHNYNSGTAGMDTIYAIPNKLVQYHPTKSPLRQGSYRALASTANHFARESHMDELAQAVGIDPLEFRLKNLKDARQRAVLQAAAEKFGWGKSKARDGHGFGIAGGFEKNGYVASAVEVAVDAPNGNVRVLRVVTAFDCGAVVNPDHLKNQIEGSMVMGLGGALFEALQFENGRVTNARLSTYRVPRFSDVPVLETVLVDRKDVPSAGAGECPIVALAPAVAGAIFAATGIRQRSMPMAPSAPSTNRPS